MTRMSLTRSRAARTLRTGVAVAAAVASVAYGMTGAAAAPGGHFHAVSLVADRAGHAQLTDHDLVNPWGLAFGPSTPLWVANNGSDTATLYQGAVNGSAVSKVPLTVHITGGVPSGQIFNPTNGFVVSDGTHSAPALFIFSSEAGDITGWAPSVAGGATAIRGAHVAGAVFKSLTIAPSGSQQLLYAADFHNSKVDVFDEHFHMINNAHLFVDPNLPAHYAPFSIQLIGKQLYVTYAVQDSERMDDVAGAGHGIVDVYTRSGHLLRRLVSHGLLDSPWGLTVAPSNFGHFAGSLLVGNFGNGTIHAYDMHSGAFRGTLTTSNGKPLTVDGLWAITPGNGTFGTSNELVFSAGPDSEAHGNLGLIRVG